MSLSELGFTEDHLQKAHADTGPGAAHKYCFLNLLFTPVFPIFAHQKKPP